MVREGVQVENENAGGFVIARPAPLPSHRGAVLGLTLMSDLHIGAAHVDYKLIASELASAGKKEDRILINGDVFDLILAGDRKRFTGDVLHPKLQGRRNVINGAVEMAVELLAPYAHQIDMIGLGNHESAVEKIHSVDPLLLLIYELEKALPKEHKDHVIHYGGFTGFVDYRFQCRPTSDSVDENARGSRLVVYYHHGSGASAPVTKGMIDFARKDVFIDADIIWLGHKHNRLNAHVQKLSCPIRGLSPNVRDVRHVMTGGYFDTYVGQSQSAIRNRGRKSNYAADAGLAPQGKGGARVEIVFGKQGNPYKMRVVQ